MTAEAAAQRVLNTGPAETEADIRQHIGHLLAALGHDEFNLEFRMGGGAADIYLPRLRTVIEIKRTGRVERPDESVAGDRSPFRQLDGYVQSAVAAVRGSQFQDKGDRRWTGMLTDGRVWHRWSYEHRDSPSAQVEQQGFQPAGARELVNWLRDALAGDPVGRPWIPPNPVSLFEIQSHELRHIYDGLSGDVARETQTKRGLWGDMLRSSGMYPETEQARDRLFVSHSFLVALARGVIWSMAAKGREADPKQLLDDGFVSWIVQTTQGRRWATEMLERANGYDWRMRRGDVLRPLYEAFVDAKDRRDFGEVYTPDWLAELMVRETLDDGWCRRSIEAAQAAVHNGRPLRGTGVLDPACGSGTFLYHAVLRLLEHRYMDQLPDGERSLIATRLVNGIDIHPVACEFSRATMLRALPCAPTGGQADLRVYNGDSLQLQGGEVGSLFAARNGDVQISSPGGSGMISLPGSFVGRGDLAALVRQFTASALEGRELPAHIRESAAEKDRGAMEAAHKNLREIIRREGNSVWAWYITNSVGPYALAKRRVDRIVSNPPWVKIAFVTVRERHRRLQEDAVQQGLWTGGKNAANFDVAQLFIRKCRQTFLADPSGDPAAWIVKASALKAQHWEKLRKWREETGIDGQSVDLIDVNVFGGGDARRSCLLFDAVNTSLGKARTLVGRCRAGRPAHGSTFNEAMSLVDWAEPPPPIPAAPSYYQNRGFRRGADLFPHVLVIASETEQTEEAGRVMVTTKPSTKRPWSEVPPQRVSVPRRWLLPVVNPNDMLAFSLRPGDRGRAIVPVGPEGRLLDHTAAMCNEEWRQLENIYAEHRGHGRNTPPTLTARINHVSTLQRQLPLPEAGQNAPLNRVLYPNSGDIMRGCRCTAEMGVASGGLVHATFDTADEAAYLTALLNAPSLTAAFKQSRTSNRDFALNPWKNVPIPKFDPDDETHRKLAALTGEAEAAAEVLMNSLSEHQSLSGQVVLSRWIRERLVENGIAGRIDAAVARLLPDQATGT